MTNPILMAKKPDPEVAAKGKWTYSYLYVILDVFSRYVVGWMVAHRETKQLARKLIEETLRKTRSTGTAGWRC